MNQSERKFTVEMVRPLYEQITRDTGRNLSLDEWHLIVEALQAGAMVRVENGEIEFQFRHE